MKKTVFFMFAITIVFFAIVSCQKDEGLLDQHPANHENGSGKLKNSIPPTVNIYSQNQMHKITQLGHDIKQDGKVENLTIDACQQIFETGKFSILRIPMYAMAHNLDGSIRENYLIKMVPADIQETSITYEKIPVDNEWFYLRNIELNKFIKGFDDDLIEMASTSYTGPWTQWKLVDAGNGWFHIINKGLKKFIRGSDFNRIELVDTTSTGTWTQWKLIDNGNGDFYIKNKGHNTFLKGGGNEYDPIIAAIIRAKNNGNPNLYLSHKRYDSDDFKTYRNSNFGPFYSSSEINASGFADAIDFLVSYIYSNTGKAVTYIGPRCELGSFWDTTKFVEVVNNINSSASIVSPEAAYAINSNSFWSNEIENITDIKSTHNKAKAPDWPNESIYDWNGETIGGNGEELNRLINELNQSFYKGKVSGVVFWGDTHLLNTFDDDNNGPFRRELVDALDNNLVECDATCYEDDGTAIALKTNITNQIKVFYSSSSGTNLTFDGIIDPSSIPADASNVLPNSFVLDATGKDSYRSLSITIDSPLDLSVPMVSMVNQNNKTQWEKIATDGDWFHLRNHAYNYYLKGYNWNDNIEIASTKNSGSWTQWKLVDAGNGWYHIENRGLQKYIRGILDQSIELIDKSYTGSWTQWKLVDAGNGFYYIKNRGHQTYLQAGN